MKIAPAFLILLIYFSALLKANSKCSGAIKFINSIASSIFLTTINAPLLYHEVLAILDLGRSSRNFLTDT